MLFDATTLLASSLLCKLCCLLQFCEAASFYKIIQHDMENQPYITITVFLPVFQHKLGELVPEVIAY